MATRTLFSPPEQFEEYRIVRPLGGGAMGQVYLAHDTLLDRPVAIKFIANLEESVLETELRERFFIEARAIARLQHPNVVLIYRVGEYQRRPYLVSEFVRGQSLDRIKKPLTWSRVHRIGIGLSRGLAAAHRRGVLHRDIKPANAMLTHEGEVKILDFGLAKLVDTAMDLLVSDAHAAVHSAADTPGIDPNAYDAAHDTRPDPQALQPVNGLAATLPLGSSSAISVPPALAGTTTAPAATTPGESPRETSATSHRPYVRSSTSIPEVPGLAGPATSAVLGGPAGSPTGAAEIGNTTGDLALDATLLPGSAAALSALSVQTLPSGATPGVGSSTADRGSASLTQLGEVIGSPLYMAPELWRGEPATRQADIYSLGTVLFELCAGRAPHEGVPLPELPLRVQDRDARPLAEVVPDADPRFCAIVDRCLRRNPVERFESGDALRAALEQLSGSVSVLQLPEGNPYRGLQAFEAQHKDLFFGRSAEVSAIIDRLRSEPLVILAGNSGVGKSSLVRAGVMPQIEAGALGPVRIATIVPGKRPLLALATALSGMLSVEESKIMRDLSDDPQAIGRAVRQRNRQRDTPLRLLLFIDQLEELLTLSESPTQTGEALGALLSYAPDIRMLCTVRSDFLSRLVLIPGIGPEVSRGLQLISPLSPDGLREAITQPALAMGYAFESAALVESLVGAAGQSDGSLPLLQFTLAALWEARDPERRIIPAAALHALGGVGGALARHADAVYERLLPKQRAAARRLLGQLITVEGTRQRRRREELIGGSQEASGSGVSSAQADARADAAAALDALTVGRILSVRPDESGEGSAYELAHEALLTSWGSLRVWLAEDANQRAVRQRLSQAAGEWDRLGRSRELLWRRRQLAETAALSTQVLAPREADFLSASRRAVRTRRAGIGLLLAAAPLFLVLMYVTATLRAREAIVSRIAEQASQARSELSAARAASQRAEQARQNAYHAFDERKQSEAEAIWDQMRSLQNEALQGFRRAGRDAEAAFLLDSRRNDMRQLLATILFEHALAAERDYALALRDDLYERLWLYDTDGSFRKRWEAPATVDIDSDPPGAQVTLTPIDGQRRLRVESTRRLGQTPLLHTQLAPGGYLLSLNAPGRIEVKYPILVERDERLPLRIYLPAPAQVPPGFIYIPAGRFLFGSAADDDSRRVIFAHVPLHTVRTPAFLISRYETSFADWIAFLRSLPPDQRAHRFPRAGEPGAGGTVQLHMRPDGKFELMTQPSQQSFDVREGEFITYPGRQKNARHNWLRFPVTAVNADDVQAYTHWLNSTGKFPGARLCTEFEWERAARGADGRAYPHADRLAPDDANYDQTYGQDPVSMGMDEPGLHPLSRSLFGVDDLVGNAYEWVGNSISQKSFTLRGGAYYYDAVTSRTDNRHEPEPGLRHPTAGIRICATMPSLP